MVILAYIGRFSINLTLKLTIDVQPNIERNKFIFLLCFTGVIKGVERVKFFAITLSTLMLDSLVMRMEVIQQLRQSADGNNH